MTEAIILFLAGFSAFTIGHWIGHTKGRHDGYHEGLARGVAIRDSVPPAKPNPGLRLVKGGKP